MKTTVLPLIFICFNFISYGQNYKVTYRHCLQTDTSKILSDTVGAVAVLIGNSYSSNYVYLNRPSKTINQSDKSITLGQLSEQKESGSTVIKFGTSADSIGCMVFYNRTNDSVFVRDKISSGYVVVREKMPLIQWKITNETKKIKNYNCRKAIAYFRGRNYTAWFTGDIPIAEGPWKFKGLPGLLLSLEDDKKQVKIYAEKVEYPVPDNVPSFVAQGKPVSIEKYITIRNDEVQNDVKKIQAALSNQEGMIITGQQPKFNSIQKGFFGIEKSLE